MEKKWKKVFLLPKQMTKFIKMQEMQYRILHRLIPTNHLLHKRKAEGVQSPNCRICGKDETLTHLLLYCTPAMNIWKWLQAQLYKSTGLTVELHTQTCILGINCKKRKNGNGTGWLYN